MNPARKSAQHEVSSEPDSRGRRQRVQSVQTGMAVLKGLARLGGRASLTVLAAHVQESPAKIHRYLMSLVDAELVSQDPVSQQYFLATESMLIGLAAMRQAEPVRLIEPALVRIREQLEVTCFVAVMGNKGPTIVRFEEPGLPVTVNVRVGSVLSLVWSATGRVFLCLLHASRVDAQAKEELARSPADLRTLLDATDPFGALAKQVQAAQCAIVRDTNLKGISAVSAPVYDYSGNVCAALTALGASGGFDASIDGEVARAIRSEARAASARLGCRSYPGQG